MSRAGSRARGLALILNAGSRTIKASLIDGGGRTLAAAEADRPDGAGEAEDRTALEGLFAELRGADAGEAAVVGHRVVHGGSAFRSPVVLNEPVLRRIDALSALAPLHNPTAVAVIRVAMSLMGSVPHVACFDTAFHATLPETAWRYPVPDRWLDDWGIRRYGFHGLSVEWAIGETADRLDKPLRQLDLVVAHLGGGCSVTAVHGGRSAWTSMGLTPLEGLMMASRSGSIDPGALVLALRHGLDPTTLEAALDRASGLLAVGGSGDLRVVEERARGGDPRARLAIDMFVDRAAAGIAAAATRLHRLDALVFTGGIGEHSGRVRSSIVRRLAAVRGRGGEGPRVLVVEAREDLVIARAAFRLARAG
ncbi:MAG TPA: acetate/propionate family kinase [Candidatus Limnocylindrales bacterium]|nr:acetate/propionate family kinase [Candidatus Limnocylindrales bacterium]